MAPQLRLHYFPAEGRAEKIRLPFVLGKIDFEDVRHTDWGTFKPTTKFGTMPLLEIDGVQYGESGAILRYAGKLSGLYPTDPIEALRVDEVISLTEDVGSAFSGQYAIRGNPSLSQEQKDAELKKFFEDVAATKLPRFFAAFEKLLGANGSGFFVGSAPTLADVVVYTILRPAVNKVIPLPENVLDSHPGVKAFYHKIDSIPEVAAWYSKTH